MKKPPLFLSSLVLVVVGFLVINPVAILADELKFSCPDYASVRMITKYQLIDNMWWRPSKNPLPDNGSWQNMAARIDSRLYIVCYFDNFKFFIGGSSNPLAGYTCKLNNQIVTGSWMGAQGSAPVICTK